MAEKTLIEGKDKLGVTKSQAFFFLQQIICLRLNTQHTTVVRYYPALTGSIIRTGETWARREIHQL